MPRKFPQPAPVQSAPTAEAFVPPDLLAIGNARNSGPGETFGRLYKGRVAHLFQQFPAEEHADAQVPPKDPGEFFRRYRESPAFHQALSAELWTILNELQANKWQANGHVMHEHQRAYVAWLATALCNGTESPDTLLLEGAPGTGKTLVLGTAMQAYVRVQARRLLAEQPTDIGVYVTAKSYYLPQQTMGVSSQVRRILRANTFDAGTRQVNKLRRYGVELFGDQHMDEFFKNAVWKTLFAIMPANVATAREIVKTALGPKFADFMKRVPGAQDMLATICELMVGNRTLIRDGDTVRVIDLPEADGEEGEAGGGAYGGDAAFGVPRGWPIAMRGATSTLKQQATETDPRLVFGTNTMFGGSGPERHSELLGRTEFIVVDEARKTNGDTFVEPVVENRADHRRPVVIAATSMRYGDADWQAMAPGLKLREATELNILPHVGVHVFPAVNETRYPSGTQEGLDQCMAGYFDEHALPASLDLPQPHRRNTLMIVPPMLARAYEAALRAGYEKRPKKAERAAHILCLDGRTPADEKPTAMLWFLKERGDGPNVLIAAPNVVTDSLDLTNIGHLMIAAPVNADTMERLLGRLTHSQLEGDANHRCYVTQQLFADVKQSAVRTLPHGLDLPEQDLRWPGYHRVFSQSGYETDRKLTRTSRNGTLLPDAPGVVRDTPIVSAPAPARTTPLRVTAEKKGDEAGPKAPTSELYRKVLAATKSEDVARLVVLANDICPGLTDNTLGGYYASLAMRAQDCIKAPGANLDETFKLKIFDLVYKLKTKAVGSRYTAEYARFLAEKQAS